jgi:hypothetical protein
MNDLLPDDLASVPIARITRAMRQLADGIKKNTMAAALICAHVYHLERWREAGLANFAAWCESVGVTYQYGYDLVQGAAHSTKVEKITHARELRGLTDETATEVVAAASARGPVTASTLREERARIETASPDDMRAARASVVGKAREVNRGATDEQVEKRLPKVYRKVLDLLRQHSGADPDEISYVEGRVEYWRQQSELSRAA